MYPKLIKWRGSHFFSYINNEDEFNKECKEMKQVYVVVVIDGESKEVDT